MAQTEHKIIRLEEELAASFNRGDVDSVLTLFSPEMVGFSSTTHDRVQSLEALRKTFEYYLQEGEKVEYKVSDILVQEYGPIAVASFHWVVTIHTGDRVYEIPGRGTHVLEKKGDDWRIVHEHFSRAHQHR